VIERKLGDIVDGTLCPSAYQSHRDFYRALHEHDERERQRKRKRAREDDE
jgi:hypothetical protein